MIKAVFFDVANTLLYKPDLFQQIILVLKQHGLRIDTDVLKHRHKLLSEVVTFPDKTSKEFYNNFNRELLYSIGLVPDTKLIEEIFNACSYLPWKPFDDTNALAAINLPKGIISNWDSSLNEKLKEYFDASFHWVLGSQLAGIRKPDPEFFQKMIEASGFNASEIMFTGDSLKLDIAPALSLGVQAVLIDRDNYYHNTNVKSVKSLHELTNFL